MHMFVLDFVYVNRTNSIGIYVNLDSKHRLEPAKKGCLRLRYITISQHI
jgi:hypothetical protein